MTVPLNGAAAKGRVALVDDQDYELVSQRRWFVYERIHPGRASCGPYAVANLRRDGRKTTIRMHSLITGWPETDHRDHNGLNNQRANLRPMDHATNAQNSLPRGRGASVYKGVSWYAYGRGKWHARIQIDGRDRSLGYFHDEIAAAQAYDAAARAAFGAYACVNFPEAR